MYSTRVVPEQSIFASILFKVYDLSPRYGRNSPEKQRLRLHAKRLPTQAPELLQSESEIALEC